MPTSPDADDRSREPAAVERWEQLRQDLMLLAQRRPHVLRSYPSPSQGYRRAPVEIGLVATAEAVAEQLHSKYGEFVSLRVGALPYPPRDDPASSKRIEQRHASDLDIALDGPLVVRSGETVRHGVLVTNRGPHELGVRTNGHVTAVVIDDEGAAVGGWIGAERQPLVVFTLRPADPVRIPLLVGTGSLRPALGYVVPPGRWHLVAPLHLSDGRDVTTQPLELTVIS